MAFMMPVVKNDYDIYNSHQQRSRRVSEGAYTTASKKGTRSRKVSDTAACYSRSEGPSLSTSPVYNDFYSSSGSPVSSSQSKYHRSHSYTTNNRHGMTTRNGGNTFSSQHRTYSSSDAPTTSGSQSPVSVSNVPYAFSHNNLINSNGSGGGNGAKKVGKGEISEDERDKSGNFSSKKCYQSEASLSKFHNRLMDKLRRSLRCNDKTDATLA